LFSSPNLLRIDSTLRRHTDQCATDVPDQNSFSFCRLERIADLHFADYKKDTIIFSQSRENNPTTTPALELMGKRTRQGSGRRNDGGKHVALHTPIDDL